MAVGATTLAPALPCRPLVRGRLTRVTEGVAVDLTIELVARVAVVAACLSQLAAGVAVLIRERVEARPAPVERAVGPVALVNYVGIAMFIFVGLAVAITNFGAVLGLT